MNVTDILTWLDARAPFETQLSFDNCGLIVGSRRAEVHGVHVALDCTDAVLDEMAANGADLLITHHPLLFSPVKQIMEDDHEGRLITRMIRAGISFIAVHTCLDAAQGGINDVLAETIGLQCVAGEGFCRVGDLPVQSKAADFAKQLEASLGDAVRLMGDGAKTVSRVCVSSGAGSDGWEYALAQGADAFVTGEMKHHHALAAAFAGLVCFECGHHATEEPGIFALADALQKQADVVQ